MGICIEDTETRKYTLNGSAATVIAGVNVNRIIFSVCVDGAVGVGAFVRLKPAAEDPTEKAGIFITGGGHWEMPEGVHYTGEVSAIASNNSPQLHVTEAII